MFPNEVWWLVLKWFSSLHAWHVGNMFVVVYVLLTTALDLFLRMYEYNKRVAQETRLACVYTGTLYICTLYIL